MTGIEEHGAEHLVSAPVELQAHERLHVLGTGHGAPRAVTRRQHGEGEFHHGGFLGSRQRGGRERLKAVLVRARSACGGGFRYGHGRSAPQWVKERRQAERRGSNRGIEPARESAPAPGTRPLRAARRPRWGRPGVGRREAWAEAPAKRTTEGMPGPVPASRPSVNLDKAQRDSERRGTGTGR